MVVAPFVAWFGLAASLAPMAIETPHELVLDAWSEGVVDARASTIDDFAIEATGDATPRAVRFALPAELPTPCTIEVRAAWFDAAIVVRDHDGVSLAQDDDGWYGVHPAIELEGDVARAARCIDVVALHAGVG